MGHSKPINQYINQSDLNMPPKLGRKKTRLSVGFILTKHFTLCAFANFIDVLRLAADEGDRSRHILCDWAVLSHDMAPITASCGINIYPTERLTDPQKFDYLVVVGGLIEAIPDIDKAYLDYLRLASSKKIPLIGICTGGFILHQAGLMQGYRCCVSWFHYFDFLEQFEGLLPISDQIFIVDRDRLTCSGGTNSAHLAAYLVEKHVGRAAANKSLHIMMIEEAKHGENPQPAITLEFKTDNPMVKRALLIMQQNIDSPLTIEVIAQKLTTSTRQLERYFQQAIGISPSAAFMAVRLNFARHLIQTTNRPIATIAVDCGFCDSSHLSRMFRRRFGVSPHELRPTELNI